MTAQAETVRLLRQVLPGMEDRLRDEYGCIANTHLTIPDEIPTGPTNLYTLAHISTDLRLTFRVVCFLTTEGRFYTSTRMEMRVDGRPKPSHLLAAADLAGVARDLQKRFKKIKESA